MLTKYNLVIKRITIFSGCYMENWKNIALILHFSVFVMFHLPVIFLMKLVVNTDLWNWSSASILKKNYNIKNHVRYFNFCEEGFRGLILACSLILCLDTRSNHIIGSARRSCEFSFVCQSVQPSVHSSLRPLLRPSVTPFFQDWFIIIIIIIILHEVRV